MKTIHANAPSSVSAHKTAALVVASVIALGAVACDKDNGGPSSAPPSAPAAASPADSATITGANLGAPDPLANVENKGRIKQYPDEVKITPPKQAALITGFTVQVREAPRGEVVSTSESVQSVREIARDSRNDYFLVVFADPNAPGKQLAGWVYKDALENSGWWSDNDTAGAPPVAPVAPAGAKTPKSATGVATKMDCAHGESHMRTTQDFCAKACKDDTGCDKSAEEICDGLGFQVQESSGKMSNASYCISSASPKVNDAHGPQHGSSAALDRMNDATK